MDLYSFPRAGQFDVSKYESRGGSKRRHKKTSKRGSIQKKATVRKTRRYTLSKKK